MSDPRIKPSVRSENWWRLVFFQQPQQYLFKVTEIPYIIVPVGSLHGTRDHTMREMVFSLKFLVQILTDHLVSNRINQMEYEKILVEAKRIGLQPDCRSIPKIVADTPVGKEIEILPYSLFPKLDTTTFANMRRFEFIAGQTGQNAKELYWLHCQNNLSNAEAVACLRALENAAVNNPTHKCRIEVWREYQDNNLTRTVLTCTLSHT